MNVTAPPKKKRTSRRSPPSAPAVQNVITPPPYNSGVYYPVQTTYTPDNVPVPQGFESARANQATTMGILSRSADHAKEAEAMRAMYDRGLPTINNPIADIGLPAEPVVQPVQPVQPVQEPYDVRDNPLAEVDDFIGEQIQEVQRALGVDKGDVQPEIQPSPKDKNQIPEGFVKVGEMYKCVACEKLYQKGSISSHLNSQKHKNNIGKP